MKQLVFALLLCERMMPALKKFSTDCSYDAQAYCRFLNDAWVKSDASKTEAICVWDVDLYNFKPPPDTEEYNHPLTSAALNATLAIQIVRELLFEFDIDKIIEMCGLAQDTVMLYTSSNMILSPAFEEVMKGPSVQQELKQQVEDAEILAILPEDFDQSTVSRLKKRAVETQIPQFM